MRPEAIAVILETRCPAFIREGDGPAVWHNCFCKALPVNNSSRQHCVCVWHQRDTCHAGKWPQLSMLTTNQEKAQNTANEYLAKAKIAITKLEQPGGR